MWSPELALLSESSRKDRALRARILRERSSMKNLHDARARARPNFPKVSRARHYHLIKILTLGPARPRASPVALKLAAICGGEVCDSSGESRIPKICSRDSSEVKERRGSPFLASWLTPHPLKATLASPSHPRAGEFPRLIAPDVCRRNKEI